MPRKKEPPGIQAYYNAIQKALSLQSEILTGVLPHYGERGRNDEDWFAVQEAHERPPVYRVFTSNGLLRFLDTLLYGIQSYPMGMASIEAYHKFRYSETE